jgi:hypothetical protein
MLKVIVLSSILLALALAGLALNIIFRKNGHFPKYRVGHNKNMKKLGITCIKHEELKCYNKILKEKGCESCSE